MPAMMPPAFTLPSSIDVTNEESVRAFMESCARAWRSMVEQRHAAGCCIECGQPIIDPRYGCTNLDDVTHPCLEALLAQARHLSRV